MKIESAKEAKKYIGQVLYWEETSARYWFLRSGVLTQVSGSLLEFNDSQDWKRFKSFPKLDTEPFTQ